MFKNHRESIRGLASRFPHFSVKVTGPHTLELHLGNSGILGEMLRLRAIGICGASCLLNDTAVINKNGLGCTSCTGVKPRKPATLTLGPDYQIQLPYAPCRRRLNHAIKNAMKKSGRIFSAQDQ